MRRAVPALHASCVNGMRLQRELDGNRMPDRMNCGAICGVGNALGTAEFCRLGVVPGWGISH